MYLITTVKTVFKFLNMIWARTCPFLIDITENFKNPFFYLFFLTCTFNFKKKFERFFFQFESFKENMTMFLCDGKLDLILSGIYKMNKEVSFFFYQWSLYVNWPYFHSVCCKLKLVDFANHESVLYILVKFTFNYKIQEKLAQFFYYF